MATQSSIVAWRIPWTEEPSGLQFMGLQRVRQDSAAIAEPWPLFFTFLSVVYMPGHFSRVQLFVTL